MCGWWVCHKQQAPILEQSSAGAFLFRRLGLGQSPQPGPTTTKERRDARETHRGSRGHCGRASCIVSSLSGVHWSMNGACFCWNRPAHDLSAQEPLHAPYSYRKASAPISEGWSPRTEHRAADAYHQLNYDRHQRRGDGHSKATQGSDIERPDGEGIGQKNTIYRGTLSMYA